MFRDFVTVGVTYGAGGFDLHLDGLGSTPTKKETHLLVCLFFGGGWWIRTTEGIASRFTVCPLWPLGKSPIFISVCMEPVDGLVKSRLQPVFELVVQPATGSLHLIIRVH